MGSKWKRTGCTHAEATRVIKVGEAQIWAGSQEELLDHFDWGLIISAVGYTKFGENPLSGNKTARALLPEALFAWTPPPCIGIDWPDNGTPALGSDWWAELTKVIRTFKGDIGLCCFGGHGRTGTMLAILAVKLGKVKKGDCPVAWVRKRYCENAVESNSQLDYIERITGVTVPSDASNVVATLPLGGPPGSGGGSGTNPTQAGPWYTKPQQVATVSGSEAGLVLGDNPTDEELLDAWLKTDGDCIEVVGASGARKISPIFDKEGELVGWQGVGSLEA